MQLVDSTADFLRVKVAYSGSSISLRYVYLFGHCKKVLVHAEAKPIFPGQAVFTIDKKKIPEGITHLTVFNEDLKAVCERLYFTKPVSTLRVNVTSDQAEYSPRRKVTLQMDASTAGTQTSANFSVSVYKIDSIDAPAGEGIFPYLMLTSELKGKIASPEFYFSDDAAVKEAADNLMLTHGWRRFAWESVLSKKTTLTFVPEYRTHLVTGKVMKADGSPAPDVLAFLSSPSKLVNLNGTRSNAKGELNFEVHDFWGPRRLILQTNTSIDSTLKLSISNPFSTEVSSYPVPAFSIAPSMHKALQEKSLSMQVQDIYYREIVERSAMRPKKDSTAFYGKSDQTYFLDSYTRFPVMEEVMREYVPGVLVRKRRDGFHFLVLDVANKGVLSDDPLVLLDGVPIFDVDQIMAFNPLKVKKLEVVMRNYILGPLRVPGLVSYSTYTGDLAGFELDPRVVSVDYEGLQLQREFYAPKYENTKMRGSRLPDQRTLLHWEPIIHTAGDGKATLEFYTSDVSGKYQVIVEGLTHKGKAGSGTHTFAVKRIDF